MLEIDTITSAILEMWKLSLRRVKLSNLPKASYLRSDGAKILNHACLTSEPQLFISELFCLPFVSLHLIDFQNSNLHMIRTKMYLLK